MPIRGSNVHLCLRTSLASKHSWLTADPTYGVLVMTPFQKTWLYISLLKRVIVMDINAGAVQVQDWSNEKAYFANQGFQVENLMTLTFGVFHHRPPLAYEITDDSAQKCEAFVPHS